MNSTTDSILIRRLTPEDVVPFREVRLESLRLCPAAYGSTFELESAFTLEKHAERLINSHYFGVFEGSELVGIAALIAGHGNSAHMARLVAVYVRESARNRKLGRRLVEAVITSAPPAVEIIQLGVNVENEPARRLYAAVGFREYSIEPKSIKSGGRYYDEVLMMKELR